ncbi:type II toxin-antitoxin system RelE/ParE family toxin [Campylobacter hyointestinalis]|uniref:Type II toxin-antitoxin system mRNA interferase toxin, RelE/StbE family n=1 Tax=Campylobacter hyointestinalis subsp. hyointestinalis TaxID=91352 RepID=A0A855NCQ3_CAMHY|nr:type II toxin-antitoxin system YafQ family toxin [Campylobacter hyointestinalis]PPB55951.1 type II toxin-antitoxin system mRNA interferase toxin, RelE/StbE family [Campylobacter hyointestinalis subsp. hyointestinalis]PPB70050.1 type II toxin-antitoxin system mRNA interferase toxin, RelE/StbE family [Campylobacter hyointestinalis subsp. hyointestinalis]RAZ23977.1 type II toxin-antitoxin system YafQ family toxin [Campylobacter hyointestinalis subsp. lawsonii]RAZ38394.1 type II toxin-antitoxin 
MNKNRKIIVQKSFDKDYRLVKKQGWDLKKINKVVTELQSQDELSPSIKDHPLIGNLKDYRECHIFGDLIIIYQRDDESLTLYRIGRHQDLFKNY